MLFSIELDSKLPTSGASIKSMDVEKLFGVYGGVIGPKLGLSDGKIPGGLWQMLG